MHSQVLKEKMDFGEIRSRLFMESLKAGRPVEIPVRGESMYPYIKNYDILTVEPVSVIRPGEIVMVKDKCVDACGYLIHRLVKINRIRGQLIYYTRGDNQNSGLEGPFVKEQICGKVVAIKRSSATIRINIASHLIFGRLAVLISSKFPRLLKIASRFFCLTFMYSPLGAKLSKLLFLKDRLHANTQNLFILILQGIDADNGNQKKAVDLIKEGLRWNYFCDLVLKNGVVIEGLEDIRRLNEFVQIPYFVLERLSNARLNLIAEASRSHRQLIEILTRFQKSGIAVIPIKGTLLAFSLYNDIAKRGLSEDIDLLIKEEDKAKACLLLRELRFNLQPEDEIEPLRWNTHFYKNGYLPVELSWDITMMLKSKERAEGLWNSLSIKQIFYDDFSISYYSWDNVMLLLFLSADLVNSRGFRNFRHLLDIKTLVGNLKNIDWADFIRRAYQYRLNNSAYLALVKIKELFNAEIPNSVLNKLRPGIFKILFMKIFITKDVIFSDNLRKRILDRFLSYVFFELIEAGSFLDYLRITKRIICPSRETFETTYAITNLRYILCLLKRLWRGFSKVSRTIFED